MSKDQINLPKTAFSMKANLPIREPKILELWRDINLYNKELTVNFNKFIRKEKKFKNVKQLRKQIKIDLLTAKKSK